MPLVIAGLGIKFLSHLTKETESIIQESDKVLYLANDTLFPEWILLTNKNSESLENLYFSQANRHDSYNVIKDKILTELDQYKKVSFIIYGNPNLLVQITALVERAAKGKGHAVYILPAVSSLDCLLADLNINPGCNGMQLLEATELIVCRKIIDTTSHVVIFQPAAIGQNGHDRNKERISKGLNILCDYLYEFYEADQSVVLYEASQYPKMKPIIIHVSLSDLGRCDVSSKTTLYLAPAKKSIVHQDAIQQIKSIFTDFDASTKESSI